MSAVLYDDLLAFGQSNVEKLLRYGASVNGTGFKAVTSSCIAPVR